MDHTSVYRGYTIRLTDGQWSAIGLRFDTRLDAAIEIDMLLDRECELTDDQIWCGS